MSFSSRIKEELSRHMSPARHCQIAEIAAILSLCGRIQISGDDHYSIKIHTENVTVARKCFTLLRKTFNIETDISIRRNAHLGKNRIYSVCVKQHEDALRVLKATKLLTEDGEVGENLSVVGNVVVQNPCCRRAFLRGAFLASGSISDPEKFYHFEIVCATDAKARQIQSIMATFDIDAKIVIRKRYYVVYIKEGYSRAKSKLSAQKTFPKPSSGRFCHELPLYKPGKNQYNQSSSLQNCNRPAGRTSAPAKPIR